MKCSFTNSIVCDWGVVGFVVLSGFYSPSTHLTLYQMLSVILTTLFLDKPPGSRSLNTARSVIDPGTVELQADAITKQHARPF